MQKLCALLQASHCVCDVLQVSEKMAEGGDKASMSAVDMAKQVADQAVPTADRINQKIEKEAHELTANSEFHAKDVASEYQKGAKVHTPSVALLRKQHSSAVLYLVHPSRRARILAACT